MKEVHGTECWGLKNEAVSLSVSSAGAMLAPAEFRLQDRVVSPYAMAPWRPDEVAAELPVLLKVLRGDFFCLPFGPQENGDPHGAPANAEWQRVDGENACLHLVLEAADSGARIERRIALRDGQTAIYYEHRISGLEGEWSYGNHPILDCSAQAAGSVRLSVSPFRWGSVYQGVFSEPENGEYQALKPGARFSDLREVPMANGGVADLTRFPARQGFEDLVMMVSEAASDEQPFAWSAACFDGYLWFALKNPADFPSTLFWLSNGGRHGGPWNGRHLGRIGIEEVCSHFCDSVDDSRRSELTGEGIPTTRKFSKDERVSLRIVQAVTAVPAGFGRVTSIRPAGAGAVVITDESGTTAEFSIDWSHVL